MNLFRLLFAEKILRFYEDTNLGIRVISQLPGIRNKVTEETFSEDHNRLRVSIGILVQFIRLIVEFLMRFLYFLSVVYIPYALISMECPLIAMNKEGTIIYMVIILSVFCGSIANNLLYSIGDRDYLMIKVMLVSPYMNFLGRLVYRMITEFVFYMIIFLLFGMPIYYSFGLCFIILCSRPIGEMIAIFVHDHIRWIYDSKGVYNGVIMALSVLLAYGIPLFNRSLSVFWIEVINIGVLLTFAILGGFAMYFLWWYKRYRVLVRDALHIKHEA